MDARRRSQFARRPSIARARRDASGRSASGRPATPGNAASTRDARPRLRTEPNDEQVPGVFLAGAASGQDQPTRGRVAPRTPARYRSAIAARAARNSRARRSWASPIAAARSVEVVLEPGRLDLVVPAPRRGIALPGVAADAVEPHRARPRRERVVVGHEHPALAGRDRLGRVEAEGAGSPEGAREPPAERRDRGREGVGDVLDDSGGSLPLAGRRYPRPRRRAGRPAARRRGLPRPRSSAARPRPRPPPGRR